MPKTTAGKMFCIGYALIGIPLLLVFMANIGDLMAVAFRWIYRSVGRMVYFGFESLLVAAATVAQSVKCLK